MDSPDQGQPNLNSQESKNDAISELTKKDRKAFYEWSADPNNKGKLALPEAVLRYMLIPQRIFEVAEDPTKVRLDIVQFSTKNIWSLVVEHKYSPVTNMDSRRRFLEEREKFLKTDRSKQGNPLVFFPPIIGAPASPTDVDQYHIEAKYQKAVEAGIFSPNDYFLNNVRLAVSDINPQVLYVADYRIRDSLQRVRIGTSFYTRLRECARELGFRFLTGQNWEGNNITYFRNKLGRSTLDQIKPEKRGEFSVISGESAKLYSIDFLYPEDKIVYTQEPMSSNP